MSNIEKSEIIHPCFEDLKDDVFKLVIKKVYNEKAQAERWIVFNSFRSVYFNRKIDKFKLRDTRILVMHHPTENKYWLFALNEMNRRRNVFVESDVFSGYSRLNNFLVPEEIALLEGIVSFERLDSIIINNEKSRVIKPPKV